MSRSRLIASLAAIALCLIATGALAVWSFPLQSPQQSTAQTSSAGPAAAPQGFTPPRLVSSVQPEYSERARNAGVQGSVVLNVHVAADGHVDDVELRDKLDPDLDQNAVAAVRKWKFGPARRDGEPVAVETTTQIQYTLDKRDEKRAERPGVIEGVVGGVVSRVVGRVVGGVVGGVIDGVTQGVVGGVQGGVEGGVTGGVASGVVSGVAGGVPQDQTVHDAHEDGVTMPKVLHKQEPQYTQAAKDAGIEGTVTLYIEVEPDGRAHHSRIEHSLHPDLDKSALDALSNWRFKPATKDGKPITVHATVEVNFRLK
jgi:TonB family protein